MPLLKPNPFAMAADILCPPDIMGWKPLPHQIPPPGEWFGWLMLGGRGTGKTDGCAKAFWDHINGPPCDPNIAGGHWPSIIAPTLSDGVTSCVNGPSGLQQFDKKIKAVQEPGGMVVKFSNGVKAKLFGAHTPDDVERLRSGGNRCFAAGTNLLTDQGWLPVETITTQHLAMTSQGLRRIDRSGYVATDEIYEVHLNDGGVLRVTSDHQHILQDGTRKSTLHLAVGDNLAPWQTSARKVMSRSGRKQTAQYRPATRSTTKTTTPATTFSRTLSASRAKSTGHYTASNVEMAGTARAVSQAGSKGKYTPCSVRSVVITSRAKYQRLAHARTHAVQSCSLQNNTEANGSPGTVTTAEKSTSIFTRTRHHVSVVACVATGVQEAVYCLRVPGVHEVVVDTGATPLVSGNCFAWLEELAAWRYLAECFLHMRMGLRLGRRPRWIASTTPKNRPLIKKLRNDSLDLDIPTRERVVITTGTTDDNPHLPAHIKSMLYKDYQHTRLGKQELLGMILEDVEGALWKQIDIDLWRVPWNIAPGRYDRIVVGVDPSVSEATGDDCGIVVDAMMQRWSSTFIPIKMPDVQHGFCLADCSIQGSPKEWGEAVVQARKDWGAELIVVEKNNGGDMCKETILNIDPQAPVKVIHHQEGKKRRFQPVAAQYEQGRWHHVGPQESFAMLEDQMTTWVEDDDEDGTSSKYDKQEGHDDPQGWKSPDHMDAHCTAAAELIPVNSILRQSSVKDNRKRGRR